MTKVGISGHRPPRLKLDYTEKDENKLKQFFLVFFNNYFQSANITNPLLNTGMANGADQAAAYAFLELGLKFDAYVPFKGMELKWPIEAQKKWHNLLDSANRVAYVCEEGYASWKFLRRDRAVVDNSDLMFFLLDNKVQPSGTRHTYEYAIEKGKQIENLWWLWEDFHITFEGK